MSAKHTASEKALVIIGSVFGLTSLVLLAAIVWFFYRFHGELAGMELKSFLTSASILSLTTFMISAFIWWILSKKSWFTVPD
jgi:hypothetical protein